MFPAAAGVGLAVGRGPHLVAFDRVVGGYLIWSLLAETGQLFEPNGASSEEQWARLAYECLASSESPHGRSWCASLLGATPIRLPRVLICSASCFPICGRRMFLASLILL